MTRSRIMWVALLLGIAGCVSAPHNAHGDLAEWGTSLRNVNVHERGHGTYYAEVACGEDTLRVRLKALNSDSLNVEQEWGECPSVSYRYGDIAVGDMSIGDIVRDMRSSDVIGVVTMSDFDSVDKIIYPSSGGRLFHVAEEIEEGDVWYEVLSGAEPIGEGWFFSLAD